MKICQSQRYSAVGGYLLAWHMLHGSNILTAGYPLVYAATARKEIALKYHISYIKLLHR